jgi:hypothetical protein
MFARLLGALVVLAGPPTAPPELNDQTYAKWRDHIRPREKELRFEEVPWRTTFWEAVTEAQKKDMPILVWAMNGHPLACT